MTSNVDEITTDVSGEGAQQIPAVVRAGEVSAAADTREALLRAIGAEAQLVAAKSAGQSSTALEELARAFALTTSGTVTVDGAPQLATRQGGHKVGYAVDIDA
ncbi:hypothetical protein OG897_40500 [Streptomyces sp. NBC_00237]|uniref:hypothetical protein n=1 Tax=Streptomyces sp. NBC_00237 TaxID=2975687 RepID=UPI00225981F4|nr:hypothetical protein [Streptomyces sp. NBC_00237]MCX5207667.1 hypothetical protein [Streptomyces sp. NBC_00237]